MIEIRSGLPSAVRGALAIGLTTAKGGLPGIDPAVVSDEDLRKELTRYIAEVEHDGAAGVVHVLDRPGSRPSAVILVGAGVGDESGWRSVGAATVRAASKRWAVVHLRMPPTAGEPELSAVAEAALLASYRYRLGAESGNSAPKLRRMVVETEVAGGPAELALSRTTSLTDAVVLARDLTNAPSTQKSPQWFADRISAAAIRRTGLQLKVLDDSGLAECGFGGILAVGGGSPRKPRLVELSWRPRARRGRPRPLHVVLAGKGITFDTGGISLKPLDGMTLMRKDMAGAAAACATVLAAADLELPVRVTALAPMAENLVSGASYRPGDVVRHYGGTTTEVQNTDAEGRVVLADALAYAVRRLAPDMIIDLATLTGASRVALGRRTAALLTHNDELGRALMAAGEAVGERMWRLPLTDDYVGALASDIADMTNAPVGGAGAITAALFLREFTGDLRDRWVHVDMSSPAWSDSNDGILTRGATGWGVRTLVRWLSTL